MANEKTFPTPMSVGRLFLNFVIIESELLVTTVITKAVELEDDAIRASL